MDPQVGAVFERHFSAEDIKKIDEFLNQGFCLNGRIVVTSVFLYAKDSKKSVAEVLAACEQEWQRNWQFQHPDIKGDPDAPGKAGHENKVSLNNIYRSLEIPTPQEAKKASVPSKAVTVKTRNSTYRLGKMSKDGSRKISRDGNPIDFKKCKVEVLEVGSGMRVEELDGPQPGSTWRTTKVLSIK